MNKSIIFIGPYSEKPKGGVASVLSEYKKLFPDAYFVASTKSGNKLNKLFGFICGLIHYLFLLVFNPEIKIIHIHGASYSSFKRKYIIFKFAKWFNKKVIYHIHGAEYHLFYNNASIERKKTIANLINHADYIICLSESWKSFFLENFNPKAIKIVPNIIAQPEIHKYTDNDMLKFFFLGKVGSRKGVWFLLETLYKHKDELTDKVVFHIGGNGEIKKLDKLITDYELNDIVKYVGWVADEIKQQHLSNSDVYLLPSYNEGLPVSILEAMSYGLPILSTNVGGIPEIVSDDNGRIIEPGNEVQLWNAIDYFIKADKSILKKMGKVSQEKVKPHLPKEVKSVLINIYYEL